MMWQTTGQLRKPFSLVLGSALSAALALAIALWLTRNAAPVGWQAAEQLTLTPERAAEAFLEAYRSGAFERAAELSTGALARELRRRARDKPGAEHAAPAAFVVQESHRLSARQLRLVGALVSPGQDESSAAPVALTLLHVKQRYLVEEVTW